MVDNEQKNICLEWILSYVKLFLVSRTHCVIRLYCYHDIETVSDEQQNLLVVQCRADKELISKHRSISIFVFKRFHRF